MFSTCRVCIEVFAKFQEHSVICTLLHSIHDGGKNILSHSNIKLRSFAAIQLWFDLPPLRDLHVLNILSDVWLLKARFVSPGDVWLLFNSALRKHIFFLSTEMAYLEWFQCFYVAVCFSSHSFYTYKLFCGILIIITGGGAHKKQNKYFQYNHSASFAEKIHIDTKYGINHRSNWMNKTITVFLRSFSS